MSNLAARAAPRSLTQIRQIACTLRAELGLRPDEPVPVAALLEFALPKMLPNYVLEVKSKAEMGDDHGLAQPDLDYIALREDVYLGLVRGDGRDRFTGVHELGHLILHQRENLRFARPGAIPGPSGGGGSKLTHPEWQANTFAAEFLMDHRACGGATEDPVVLCSRFGVSISAARKRLLLLHREELVLNENADLDRSRVRARGPNR